MATIKQTKSERVSSFNAPFDTVIGQFRDESFQAIDCTGTDIRKTAKNEMHKNTKDKICRTNKLIIQIAKMQMCRNLNQILERKNSNNIYCPLIID